VDDNSPYFDALLSYYHSIGWKPSMFRRRCTTFEKVIAHANKTAKFINKIKSREIACINRAKSIPGNATTREEYIKCGKELCEELHGPYYYAYWKETESKKLKKKYIGTYMSTKDKPELENDNCNGTNVIRICYTISYIRRRGFFLKSYVTRCHLSLIS
jgi:hypothetical protein